MIKNFALIELISAPGKGFNYKYKIYSLDGKITEEMIDWTTFDNEFDAPLRRKGDIYAVKYPDSNKWSPIDLTRFSELLIEWKNTYNPEGAKTRLRKKLTSARFAVEKTLIVLAISDWDKLYDPKMKDLLKEKLRLDSEKKKGLPISEKEKGINKVKVDDRVSRPKDTSKMTQEELADYEYEKEQKYLQRMHDKAKLSKGILALNEEQAKPILKIMNFIKKAESDANILASYKNILDSMFHGDKSSKTPSSGMIRTNKDGNRIFVITSAQLGFLMTMFEVTNKILAQQKAKKEKELNKFKSLVKTPSKPKETPSPKAIKEELTNFDDLNVEDLDLDNFKLTGE